MCFWHYVEFSTDSKLEKKGGENMGPAIEYQKLMTEIVYVNLPGPGEPNPGMSGGELLHGFLVELYQVPNPELKSYINLACSRWNIHYREKK